MYGKIQNSNGDYEYKNLILNFKKQLTFAPKYPSPNWGMQQLWVLVSWDLDFVCKEWVVYQLFHDPGPAR